MVEMSRDGKRVYLTNSLYASWDAQFYPEGIDGWMVKLDLNGDMAVDPDFFVEYSGERPHQVRLPGGRRLERLVLLPVVNHTAAWLTLAGLGAYHGVNPAMGWLFAVSRGMQERSRRAVSRSLRADRHRSRDRDRARGGAGGRHQERPKRKLAADTRNPTQRGWSAA